MVKTAAVIFFAVLSSTLVFSEESGQGKYQRYALIREEMELKIETSLVYWFEDLAGKTLYFLRPSLTAEFSFRKNHSVKLGGYYDISFFDYHEAGNNVFYAPGDISLSYEYLKQINNINLFFGSQCTIPLRITNEYAAREGIFNSGIGRYTVGGSFAITGIRDPVVWNGDFNYTVGLPKKERFGTSWLPGIMRFSAGITHLSNDRFGFSAGLRQTVILPEIFDGSPVPDSLAFSTILRVEILVLFEYDYIRIAIDTTAYPVDRPIMFNLIYGHIFKKK